MIGFYASLPYETVMTICGIGISLMLIITIATWKPLAKEKFARLFLVLFTVMTTAVMLLKVGVQYNWPEAAQYVCFGVACASVLGMIADAVYLWKKYI